MTPNVAPTAGVVERPDPSVGPGDDGRPARPSDDRHRAPRAWSGWLGRFDEPRTRAWLASLLAVLLIAVAFWMAASRAVALDFHDRVPMWAVNAIPTVLSELYYGHKMRYTALESVNRRFFGRIQGETATARTINPAMRRLRETANEDAGTAYFLLGPDDKGIVDLMGLSFRLFGLRIESVITLYFALLLLSCVAFIVAFWRFQSALLLLAAFLAMLYLIMPMVAYNPQLRSLVALRALPILAMVACLHCLLFMATSLREQVGVVQIGLVVVQVLLITFTLHLRTTALWEMATILGFGLAILVGPSVVQGAASWARPRVRAPGRSALVAVGSTSGLVIAGYLGLQVYRATVFPEDYLRGDEIVTRTFWHNIFTGFAYHPTFSERYQLRLDDYSIQAATRDWLAETGRLDIWQQIGGRLPDGTEADEMPSSFHGLKTAHYDPVVRDLLIARCSTFVRECLETTFYYKPISLLQNLAWLYGFRDLPPDLDVATSRYVGDILTQQILGMSRELDAHGGRAYVWTPLVLLVLAPFVVLILDEPRWRTRAVISACLGLALGSTFPTVVGYAVPHTVTEAAIAFGMLFYLVLALTLAAGVRMVFTSPTSAP